MRRAVLLCLCLLAAAPSAASAALPSGRTSYRTWDDYARDVSALAAAHPGDVRRSVIGTTVQGREIPELEIADDVGARDGRPVALVVGLTHAREWPSGEVAMEYATELATSTDPRLRALRAAVRTVVVPVANPDGLVATLTGRPAQRTNADGVDLNRNYGAYWGGPGASTLAGHETYRGTGPWSEPETQAIHALSQQLPITSVVSLHNIAGLVLRPPGFAALGTSPDEARMRALGDAMAAVTGYRSALDDTLGDITGALEDWNYAAQGAYAYTIELGPSGSPDFHGPFTSHVVAQYPGVRDALVLAGEAAADRADHLVITGRAPAGRTLTLTKSFDTPTSPVCADDACTSTSPALALPDVLDPQMVVPSSGRFSWDVGPSTRPWVGRDGGHEAWTLSCASGKVVAATHAITAGRGQTATIDPCDTRSRVAVGASSTFALSAPASTKATLLARGALVRARCGRACSLRVTVSLGTRRVGLRTTTIRAGRTTSLRVPLTAAGERRVRSSAVRTVRIGLRASDDTDAARTAVVRWVLPTVVGR